MSHDITMCKVLHEVLSQSSHVVCVVNCQATAQQGGWGGGGGSVQGVCFIICIGIQFLKGQLASVLVYVLNDMKYMGQKY